MNVSHVLTNVKKMAKHFPNFKKTINLHIQETQQI